MSADTPRCAGAAGLLHERVRALFESGAEPRVGVEVEAIPVRASDGEPVAPAQALPTLRALAKARGWPESTNYAGAPAFRTGTGGTLTFEPGGQVEYATAPMLDLGALDADLTSTLVPVGECLEREGIRLLARGVDPNTPLSRTGLHVEGERYRRMSEHLGRIGPSGHRMMRQTAALHLNVDAPGAPLEGWRAACAMAPALMAAFANSPTVDGRPSGHRSTRAAQWRLLDPSRTGLVATGPDPVREYLDFALGAEAFLLGPAGVPARPLRAWIGELSSAEIDAHLSTLFPEVRPRGYLEVRSVDALPLRWVIVPTALLVGLLFDPRARAAAAAMPPWSGEALERAGRCGLADPALAERVRDLFDLAEAGLAALGPAVVPPKIRARVADYRRTMTDRGLDPGAVEAGDLIG